MAHPHLTSLPYSAPDQPSTGKISLNKLPNELVSRTLSYLELDDLLQISTTNKSIHSLSKPFLELARKYRCISLGEGGLACEPYSAVWPKFHTAAMFLKEIFQKPQITHYVTHICNTVDWGDGGLLGWYEESGEWLAEAKGPAEAHNGFERFLQSFDKRLPQLTNYQAFEKSVTTILAEKPRSAVFVLTLWMTDGSVGSLYYEGHVASTRDSLLAGEDAAFFGLLLVLLLNIQKLYFADPPPTSCLNSLIRKIIDVTMCSGVQKGSRDHALSRLNTVDLRHLDTEDGVDVDFAVTFAALPSMRTLCGYMVSATPSSGPRTGSDLNRACIHSEANMPCPTVTLDREGYPTIYRTCALWPYAAGISNVGKMDFMHSNFSTAAVELLLPAFRSLQKFSYGNAGAGVGCETFEPPKLVNALQKYQGHCLEHLEMENGWADLEPAECLGSLRSFETLKVVSLDSSLVAEPVHPKPSVRQGAPFVNANGTPVTPTITEVSGPSARGSSGEVVANKLVEFLPASIEEFYLRVGRSVLHLEPMFEDFSTQHAEALPKLRRLHLKHGSHANVDLWEKMGREAGVEVNIRLACPYPHHGNTEEMKDGMAIFLERRSRGEQWRDGDPRHWDVAASIQPKQAMSKTTEGSLSR